MGGTWKTSDNDRSFELSNELCHKRWNDNTPGAAEVIVLFELMTVMERRKRHINNSKITMGFDKKNIVEILLINLTNQMHLR